MIQVGKIVDILFDTRGSFKPFEGVVIDILTCNPTDIGPIYYVSFSDGDFKVYTKKRLEWLIQHCKEWKIHNPNHIRGDPISWSSKHSSEKQDKEILNRIIKSTKK